MTLDKPTFVIIGAQKAGTTSLYHYLSQHPQVFMSAVKEPRFFSHLAKVEAGLDHPGEQAVKTLDAYRALFAGATEKAVGEASVAYLDVPGTAPWMQRYLPQARLIALLRNPADRAYSHYLMRLRKGVEHEGFEEAVAAGRYLPGGFYHRNLLPFYDHYDAGQIGVYLYDDLRADPRALAQRIFRFLEIDDTFAPDVTVRHNVGGRPRNRWVAAVFTRKRVNAWIKQAAPSWLVRLGVGLKQRAYPRAPMPASARRRLMDIYEADILALEALIDRDLSSWRARAAGASS